MISNRRLNFDGETRTYHVAGHGWNPVLSGLKTLLETGEPLPDSSVARTPAKYRVSA